tara:strand:+ start:170 stop:895 length:726 start_codon:yes stop_codon:yes gene_type:complete
MSKIVLIDADSLLYFEMGRDTLEEAIQGIDQRIEQIILETGAESYIGYLTLGKCFRYDVAKTKPYKYNRKGAMKPPIFYALRAHVQQVHKFRGVSGYEADDMVGIAKDYFTSKGYEAVISSPDKDVLQQMPGKHYNYQKAEFYETSEQHAKDFLWKQVLMGDSTDGIPGIPGLGPKTADAIIDNMPNVLNHHQVVLSQYMAKFDTPEAVEKFAETFKLVYILKKVSEFDGSEEAFNIEADV